MVTDWDPVPHVLVVVLPWTRDFLFRVLWDEDKKKRQKEDMKSKGVVLGWAYAFASSWAWYRGWMEAAVHGWSDLESVFGEG
jgi:hypothetical protein